MTRRRHIAIAGVLSAMLSLGAVSDAAATTWLVPGNGSNACTVVSPNCNTIAQAVTASSNGDTVQLGAGNFPVSAVIVLTKTLTIAGAGNASTFVQPAAGVAAFSVRTNDIVLRDFAIQNGSVGVAFQNASSNNTQITRVNFTGQTARGIDMQLGATFTVANVAITDCRVATSSVGLRMSSTSQVAGLTITGSTFDSNTYGIYQANDGSTSRLSNVTVSGCTFSNNVNYGIYVEELRDAVIEDSSFIGGSVGMGILKFYSSNGVAVANIAIRRNQFTGIKANALDLEIYGLGLGSPMTIEENTIVKDVGISTSPPSVFVRLPPALANAAVNILNNDIALSGTFGTATAAHAIQLRGNGPVVLTGNTLDGGNVGGSGTNPPSSGVFIESRAGSTVMPATTSISGSCNSIRGFRNGVSVFDSVAGTYGGLPAGAVVAFESNTIRGNSDAGAANGPSPVLDFENDWWGCPAGPGNPSCDAIIGAVDADPPAAGPPACVACVTDADCDDTRFCTGVETCNGSNQCVAASDPCSGGPECGNVCNEAANDCLVPNGILCRGSAGPCDLAESCDGVTPTCPADGFESASTVCRASAGECDVADSCSGSGPACSPDAKQGNGSACTIDGNPCSLDQCDGVSDSCQHPAGNAGASCRAIAGDCDVAETCDGSSITCPSDGFVSSATVCRGAAGTCDETENCTGSDAACPADTSQPDGTSCDDGMSCTIADVCTAGVCGGDSMTCGDGVVQGACGEVCDDGNVVSNDGCSATCQTEFVCTPAPLPGCRDAQSTKSSLQIRNNTPDTKDQLQWKWNRGEVTTKADYGTPLTTTDYRLCLYDNGGLVSGAHMPAGQLCAGKPCWRETGSGYVYKDKEATPDGITGVNLKQGLTPGKAKITIKGKGANLEMPTLPLTQPVTVQLRNSNGICWESTHSSPAQKNDAARFNDKSD